MNERDIRNKPNCRIGLIGARKNKGLTQKQLADKIHVSRSLINLLELGECGASQEIWLMLKKELMSRSVEELWRRYNYKDGYFIDDEGNKIKDYSLESGK